MKNKILVIHPELGAYGTRECVEISLEMLQDAVGGWIEPCAPVDLRDLGYQMLANEEGLLLGLEPNENLEPFFFVGDLVFVKVEGEDFVGLSDDDIEVIFNWIRDLKK